MKYAMMLVAAAAMSASAAAPAKDAANPSKELFAKKCASCHGADGKGKAAMAKMFKVKPEELDLTSAEFAKVSDADATKLITDGKNKMPAFKGKLKDAEIAGVLSYVRSLAAPAKPAAK
ncbi:MAG: cytochrome c [Elusimicrobia bacterium]|nr:cytochrome c [Elusimicrobiota bacterium]